MKANLIDPKDPTRMWEIEIEADGRISRMAESVRMTELERLRLKKPLRRNNGID